MIHHPSESTLYAVVDGELHADAARPVEAHVAACAQCAATIARAERLKRAAAAAPRTLDPPPAVLEAVRVAIAALPALPVEAEGVAPASVPVPVERSAPAGRSPRRVARAGWLAAAGIGAVAIGIAGTAPRGDRMQSGEQTARAAADSAPRPGSRVLGELLRELETRRPLLEPQTITVVEEQLQVIDHAIAETERALQSDPGNAHLDGMVQQARRQREDYLRTTLSLAAGL